ncbi:hypothetical protein [Peribacillus loiseleuriae]|uniref:Uncharacterized protein n=1 Tax=Peribacillus loiseleuriae TaxID=1679170 RepID=A0A0K9G7H3_9BACI|nr:hypothetical protein [Peribacillus loiseleuriae]KMY42775.1 hypothetical protein AC625_24280 [Peribacillus loiseleuriae]
MSNRLNSNKNFVTEALHSDALFASLHLDKVYNSKLYDEELLALDPNTMYSTTDCSDKFFHIANSTLRYYVRMLEGYLEIYVEGRKKRLPYLSVFKIHMVLLAIERGESISDIQVKLALKSIPQQNSGRAKGNKYNDEILDQLFSEFERRQNVIMKTHALQNTISQIEVDLLKGTTSKADRERQIEIIDEKIKNHRLYRKMDRQAGNILRKSFELNKKTGLFSLFSKKAAYDPEQIETEILVDEKLIKADNLEVELTMQIDILKQEISEIQTEVIALEKRLEVETTRLTNERKLLLQTIED